MERRVTVITLPDAIKRIKMPTERERWKTIACIGRHENHYLILQYSGDYPLELLYPPDIRAFVDGNWVITQKVDELPGDMYK